MRPSTSYTYTNYIADKLFNYNISLQDDLDIREFICNSHSCDCCSSVFSNKPSGRVIIGDLNIVINSKPHNFCSCGPTYREE